MNKIPLNAKQLHVLQHSLGCDKYGKGSHYRHHFVTGPGSDDFATCNELVALGLMNDHGPHRELCGGDHCFTVNPVGELQMILNSPEPPKLTRSQKRYREFIDSDCGYSFREWLGIKQKRKTYA